MKLLRTGSAYPVLGVQGTQNLLGGKSPGAEVSLRDDPSLSLAAGVGQTGGISRESIKGRGSFVSLF